MISFQDQELSPLSPLRAGMVTTHHLTIQGRPISYKRGRQLGRGAGGKPRMFLCKYHRAWLKSAVEQLRWQWADAPIPKTMHVSAKIVSYLGTKRMIDASNLYQGPEDAMQLAGVLEDDVCIEDHDGSSRRYDKLNPRVEITLTVEVSVP